MEIAKNKIQKLPTTLKESLGFKNIMAAPKITKVIISSGTGKITDKKKKELVLDRITKIAGQKAAVRPARKSIANFKLRQGQAVGVIVTLRGNKMYAFLNKLVNIAIPRMRDFKGINPKAIDDAGNITMGITEHTVFPETSEEDLRDVFGLAVTIVTTARNKGEAEALLRHIGLPLK